MKNLKFKTSFGELHALDINDTAPEVVVFMHGFPGAHQQASFLKKHAEELNLRVLAFDRPGYALSEAYKKPNLKDFITAIEEFFSEYRIQDFYMLGVSGGNPSAITASAHFGKRVKALGSVCGLAPVSLFTDDVSGFQRIGLGLARVLPQFVLEKILEAAMKKITPEQAMSRLSNQVDQSDREVLEMSDTKKMLLESMKSARAQGALGVLFDVKSFSSDWSPSLAQIKCPYLLWHGERDTILDYHMSIEVSKCVPNSKLKLYKNEGHYSLPVRRGREILMELIKER